MNKRNSRLEENLISPKEQLNEPNFKEKRNSVDDPGSIDLKENDVILPDIN